MNDPARAGSGFIGELLSSGGEGVVFCDGQHRIVTANKKFLSMFGYTEQEVKGARIHSLIVPPQLAMEAAEISDTLSGGIPVSMETVRARSDGSLLPVSVMASRLSPAWRGSVFYAIYRQLPERNGRMRRKGEGTRAGYLTALFDDAREPGMMTDSSGTVTAVNHSFCRQFGWKPDEIVGRRAAAVLVPPELHGTEGDLMAMLASGTIVETETTLLDAYGTPRATGMVASPVSLPDGSIGSFRAYSPGEVPSGEILAAKGKNRFQQPPFRHLPGIFFRVRNDGPRTIEFLSRSTIEGTDIPLPVEKGLSCAVHADDLNDLRSALHASAASGRPYQATYRMVGASGEKWVLEQGCPDEDRLGFEGYIVDITASKRVEEMVARARKRLEDLHVVAGLLQRSATESEIHRICAEAACSLLDADCGMVLTRRDGEFHVSFLSRRQGAPCQVDCYGELAGMVLETGQQVSFNSRDKHQTGCGYAGNGVCRPLTGNSVFLALSRRADAFAETLVGITDLLLGYAEQSLRRIALQRKLIDQAIHDPLTGVYNRNHFNRLVELEESRARNDGTTIGFIMVDVDSFKAINDTRGHQVGDTVLREVAAVLQRAVRRTDAVIRYGGDEFLIILSRVDSMTEMVESRIRTMLANEVFPGFTVTVSMGSSQWNAGSPSTIDEAISLADRMMYAEKRRRTR